MLQCIKDDYLRIDECHARPSKKGIQKLSLIFFSKKTCIYVIHVNSFSGTPPFRVVKSSIIARMRHKIGFY